MPLHFCLIFHFVKLFNLTCCLYTIMLNYFLKHYKWICINGLCILGRVSLPTGSSHLKVLGSPAVKSPCWEASLEEVLFSLSKVLKLTVDSASHSLRVYFFKNTVSHWQMFELTHESTKCSRQWVSCNQINMLTAWSIANTAGWLTRIPVTPQHRVHTPLRWCNFW